VRHEILALAQDPATPKRTRTELIRAIVRRLPFKKGKPIGPDSVLRVLNAHSVETGWQLPPKTASGGKRIPRKTH
jgi:hypothetical protein